jgi:hypothetical protein
MGNGSAKEQQSQSIFGLFLHYVSDAQKVFVLQLRRGLIEGGLFARTRNPDYLARY